MKCPRCKHDLVCEHCGRPFDLFEKKGKEGGRKGGPTTGASKRRGGKRYYQAIGSKGGKAGRKES